jgi:hypothetical protein
MRCAFQVDGDPRETWEEERSDLPLYQGGRVDHCDRVYEIIDGPRYEADWESATVSASFVVKPAPTNF